MNGVGLKTWFLRLSFYKIAVVIIILKILLVIIFNVIGNIVGISMGENTDSQNEFSLPSKFFLVVLLAPSIETLVQYIPFKLLYGRIPVAFILILSAVAFGALHTYNPIYVLATTFGGLLLALGYYKAKLVHLPAYWCTAAIHAIYNLIGFVLIELLGWL
jgi:membrane protease YdiL (CAAX protease family)